MDKIIIGHNPAANMLPMFYFLEKNDPHLQFVTDVPTGHNRLLAEGKIDMAPISAFSFGEHWQDYVILSDLSVSAKGKIRSILLYSKFELSELNGRKIALSSASASSVNLLRIILQKFYQVQPTYVTRPPKIYEMLEEADAALLIGDEALLGLNLPTGCRIYDLSEEWLKHTGYSMTFAVWAVRKALLDTAPELVAYTHKQLLKAKGIALENMHKIVDYCISELGYDAGFWSSYFSLLRYDLSPELLEGLTNYFSSCVEYGLLANKPVINVFPNYK